MNDHKFALGNPTACEIRDYPECEYLLQCAECDDAWTGDTLKEVRVFFFVSAFITTGNCSHEDEDIFLRTFWHHMVAELEECSIADIE